jgi:Tol biopolymer transport system component
LGDSDIVWKDLDTGQIKTLSWVGDQTDPHISGDGQHIVFTNDNGGSPEVRLWDPLTDTVTTAPATGFAAFLPDISYDGSYVVYTDLSFDGSQIAEWDVAANTTSPVPGGAQRQNPAVSGDGHLIAFQDNGFGVPSEIVTYDTITGTVARITDDALPDRNPSVSADGNFVVFEKCALSLTQCDVYLYDRTTQSSTNISDALGLNGALGEDRAPDVSGDGHYVVFSSVVSGEQDVWVWDRLTGQGQEINMGFIQRNPTISADGTTISFESQDATGQFDVVAMPNPAYHDPLAM